MVSDARMCRGGGLRGLEEEDSHFRSFDGVANPDQDPSWVLCEMLVVTVILSLGSTKGSSNVPEDICAKCCPDFFIHLPISVFAL